MGSLRRGTAAVLAVPPNLVEEASARLAEARRADAAARTHLAAVEVERATAISSGNREALAGIRSRLLEAQDEAEIARELLAHSEAAEREAIAAETTAKRRDQRAEIEAEVLDLRAWVWERYPELAGEIVAGLKRIVEIETRISDFNGSAAKRETHLDPFEGTLRPGLFPLPETVVLPALADSVCLWPTDRVPTPHWSAL